MDKLREQQIKLFVHKIPMLYLLSCAERTGSQLARETTATTTTTTTTTITMPVETTTIAIMMVITIKTAAAIHLIYEECYAVQCCSSFLQQFVIFFPFTCSFC